MFKRGGRRSGAADGLDIATSDVADPSSVDQQGIACDAIAR